MPSASAAKCESSKQWSNGTALTECGFHAWAKYPGILERPAAIGRIATAAEPEVRAGIDDAAVLVQAASHHGGIWEQLEERHGLERPDVVHDPRVVPQDVQQAAALGRSRRKARQARHAFGRVEMDHVVRNLRSVA